MDETGAPSQKACANSGSVFPYSALYGELKGILSSSCESIFILLQERSRKSAGQSSSQDGGPWIRDNALQSKLVTLKEWADMISKSCTKLTILVTKAPSESSLISLLRELSDQVQSFVGSYMQLTECSFGNPFFTLVSTKVRGELLQVTDLVSVLSKGALANANSATGMVWKTNENVQMLPLSNKAAYRRHMMEKISIVKDTIGEFTGYLEAAKSKVDTMMEDMNICDNDDSEAMKVEDNDDSMDSDGEEDFMDDAVYEVRDFSAVEDSVALMMMSLNTLKTGLGVMTLIADQCSKTIHTASDLPSPSHEFINSGASAASNEHTRGDTVGAQSDVYACNKWVSDISRQSDQIESAVTDFGAGLYPPLTPGVMSSLQSSGRTLRNHIQSYITLLQAKAEINVEAKITTQSLQDSFQIFIHNSSNFSE